MVVHVITHGAVERQALAGNVPGEEALAVLRFLSLHLDRKCTRFDLSLRVTSDRLPRDLAPRLARLRLEGRDTPDVLGAP